MRKKRTLFRYKKCILILKDLLLVALAIPTIVAFFNQTTTQHRPIAATYQIQQQSPGALPGCNCGKSVQQALQLNCKYDTLAAAWLPPHCRDDELTAIFDRSGDGPNGSWTYWQDSKHTKEFAIQDLGALADLPQGGAFYTIHRWHLVHCFFYWRKTIRANRLGVTLEQRYNTESHVTHCAKMMDNDGKRGAVSGVALNSNRWDAMK